MMKHTIKKEVKDRKKIEDREEKLEFACEIMKF